MENLLKQIAKERFAKPKSQLVHFVDDKRCYKTALTAGFRGYVFCDMKGKVSFGKSD